MEVKIQCECGTRFAFDVEPVNGRMPVRVTCPECGTDQTDSANQALQQTCAASAGPAAPVAVRQPIRMATSAPVAVPELPAVAAVGPVWCPRHPGKAAVETCHVCGKPICADCMERFGYACSVLCRKRAEEMGIELPVYGKHRAVVEERITRVGAAIWRVSLVLGTLLVAAWIWYTFFASHPSVIYSEKLPHGDRARFYRLLTGGQVLTVKSDRMILYDLGGQRQLWSVPLDVGFSPPPKPEGQVIANEQSVLYPEPQVIATTNDLWVLFPDHLIQYDRRSGYSKQEIPVGSESPRLVRNGDSLTLVSADDSGRPSVTRISLADGSAQTDPAQFGAPAVVPTNAAAGSSANSPASAPAGTGSGPGRTVAMMTSPLAPKARTLAGERVDDNYIVDGAGAVQMQVDLLEHKTIEVQAMKSDNKKSLVNENLTSGQSMEATEQMMNEMRRQDTGGVEEEDVSRYRVTLRRWPVGASHDWTGEVIGQPVLYALKDLDLLAAGQTITAFDKNNQKLWTANLTYRLPERESEFFGGAPDPPCLEDGQNLYVFDRGMLTSFDVPSGEVHWRLTSVGISQVQLDGQKNLYVTSTTASPDTLQFSQQINLSAKSGPVILKVNAASGEVIWRNEGIGDRCYLSGKFIYASRSTESPLITPGEDQEQYFDLYRLSPSDGHAMWDYSQMRQPVQVEVQGNKILLHFRGELQVLRFLSL